MVQVRQRYNQTMVTNHTPISTYQTEKSVGCPSQSKKSSGTKICQEILDQKEERFDDIFVKGREKGTKDFGQLCQLFMKYLNNGICGTLRWTIYPGNSQAPNVPKTFGIKVPEIRDARATLSRRRNSQTFCW